MRIMLNGKEWNRSGNELYEAEPPERSHIITGALWMIALGLLGFALYPWVVAAVTWFFRPLMNYFNIPY